METKVCTKCNRDLPITNFTKSSGAKYLRPECRECNNKLTKVRAMLREKYGMPNSDYVCPICMHNEEQVRKKGGRAGPWVVDHNHTTDEFRGWLCHSCNRFLGQAKDDIAVLQRAINYLGGSNG